MRLIDADKLPITNTYALVNSKDVKPNEISFAPLVCVLKSDIENAPTIERPKGKWIEKVERRGCFAGDKTVYSYTCPFCGVKEFKYYPFCHCGADMRGDV